VALPIIQGVGGVKQKPKQVFVLRFLSADADNPTYRLWKSQAFLSEKNAMKEFHDMPSALVITPEGKKAGLK